MCLDRPLRGLLVRQPRDVLAERLRHVPELPRAGRHDKREAEGMKIPFATP